MKRIFILLFIGSFSCTFLCAQFKKKVFDPALLSATWQATPQEINGENRTSTVIIFTNKSKQELPVTGWKIYFNFASTVDSVPEASDANVEHVNGDLFCIYPKESFKGLKPGESLHVEFIPADVVVNFTDAPNGLHFVWDANGKATPINNFSILPFNASEEYLKEHNYVTPQIVYAHNKNIKDISAEQLPKIFPTPVSYKETGSIFELNATVSVAADELFKNEASYLSKQLENLFGKKVSSPVSYDSNIIVLRIKNLPANAYELHVTNKKIEIDASTSAGIFYGIQSLISLMPPQSFSAIQKNISLPTVDVEDSPRFGYRAFTLDVARNFEPKEEILKLLDLMALYKLNIFHLHFSDDEGWRIEMPSLPELTTIGSKRGYTLDNKNFLQPSHGSGGDTSNHSGTGFYSKADFIEILKYANERHIMVIPEIESPGHARAAIKAMDARYDRLMKQGNKTEAERYMLRNVNDTSEYESVQDWNDNVMDVALPSTYNFISRVVTDLQQMYKEAGAPLVTVHTGGDEVPAGVWEESPAYFSLKKNNSSVQSTNDLWYYYFGKVDSILKRHNLFLAAWEEAGMRKTELDGHRYSIPNPDFVNKNFQLDVWNNTIGDGNEDLAYKLANAGYKVVLSCVSNNYFDMAYYKSFDEPGYYWGGFEDVDKPFYFIPYDYFKNVKQDKDGRPVDKNIFIGKQRLTDYGKSNIAGINGSLWGENIISTNRLEYMLLPKLIGLAERAWAKDPDWATETDNAESETFYNNAWNVFVNIVGRRELPRLDYYAGGFNYRIPMPGVSVNNGNAFVNMQLPGFQIRYTTDGSEPTVNSNLYTAPVEAKGVLKFKAFNANGRSGNTATIENE